MSMIDAAKAACEALVPTAGETVDQFAVRLYETQQETYDNYWGGICGYPPFDRLPKETQTCWREKAAAMLQRQVGPENTP